MELRSLNNQDGIALGPILFIIAILAIIAAAIAAGAGSFNANTTTENVKSLAEIIVNRAEQVSMAVQKVYIDNGCADTQINFYNGTDPVSANSNAPTDHSCDLYSPLGGGILQLPIPAAAIDATKSSAFTTSTGVPTGFFVPNQWNALANVGTTAADLLLITFDLTSSVCTRINQIVNYNPPSFTPPTLSIYIAYGFNGSFPGGANPNFGAGFTQGCYYDASYGGEYAYVRVLLAR
jgi:hypothetical protein